MNNVYLTITKDDVIKLKSRIIGAIKDFEVTVNIKGEEYYLISQESLFSSEEDNVENTFELIEKLYYFPKDKYLDFLDDFITQPPRGVGDLSKTRFSCLLGLFFSNSYGGIFIQSLFECLRHSYCEFLCSNLLNEDNFKLEDENIIDDYIVQKIFVYVC